MLSVDEAIEHAREVAKEQRKDNENCKYKSEYGYALAKDMIIMYE